MVALAALASVAALAAFAAPAAGATPRSLTGLRPCPKLKNFSCGTLTVPLDWAGQAPGTLRLQVGLQDNARAPRGVLLFLTGGPGQPGVRLLSIARTVFGPALAGYRLVMIDQRGTGAGALRCPALQAAAGSSDLTVVPRGVAAACARAIGPKRRYFTTPETVRDLDALRLAVGTHRLTIDGISYGTYVAERYALTYPHDVARLVLDSVVPQQGIGALMLAVFRAVPRVLGLACAAERCGTDPSRDVQAVVRKRGDGPQLLNTIVSLTAASDPLAPLLSALRDARAGDYRPLDSIAHKVQLESRASAPELSQGLHESTACLDLTRPWDPAASPASRAATVAQQLRRIPQTTLFPFDRATVIGNGLTRACLEWPATVPPALSYGNPKSKLPRVPVLLLAGELDLSTPVAWAREELAKAPNGKLVEVSGVGHSIQTGPKRLVIRPVLERFLRG
jgi:pimeloyl-ACP methyl ester carboxylesterase